MSEFILNSYMVLLESLHKYKNSHLVIENFFFQNKFKINANLYPILTDIYITLFSPWGLSL